MVKDYGYDDRDRLTSLTYQDGMTTLAAYNYTLDTVGNRTRVDELGGDYTTWGYDNQYRLTDETIHDGGNTISSSYTYDDVGNRTSQTVNGQATTYSYNALDQMTQSVTGGVTTTYAYDGRGNLATTTTGSDVTTYTYDALDRLITAQVPGSSAAAYTYDPTGQRVRQTVGSDTTNYLWDELSAYGDVVRETNGTGTELASYTLANTQLLAQTRSGVTSYYLSDGQDSTRALLNGTGDITDTYEYTAFGEIYNQTGSTLNNYLYTGQQFDSLTGLYSLRARYYDPGVGRFVSRDTYPINYRYPSELNRYGYVSNDPINKYDPSGRQWEYTLQNATSDVLSSTLGGGVAGFASSTFLYILGWLGPCESLLNKWARGNSGWEFVKGSTIKGLEYGAIAGIGIALVSFTPYLGPLFHTLIARYGLRLAILMALVPVFEADNLQEGACALGSAAAGAFGDWAGSKAGSKLSDLFWGMWSSASGWWRGGGGHTEDGNGGHTNDGNGSSNDSDGNHTNDGNSSSNDGNSDTTSEDGNSQEQDNPTTQNEDNVNGGSGLPQRHRYSDEVETWIDQHRSWGETPDNPTIHDLDRGLRAGPLYEGDPIKGRDLTTEQMTALTINMRQSIDETFRHQITTNGGNSNYQSIENQLRLPRYRFLDDPRFSIERRIMEQVLSDPALDRVVPGTGARLRGVFYDTLGKYQY